MVVYLTQLYPSSFGPPYLTCKLRVIYLGKLAEVKFGRLFPRALQVL